MIWRTFITCLLVAGLCGCSGFIRSTKLPVTVSVVDAHTKQPVVGATVDLQWRVGFQGYYWGKPVSNTTDCSGEVQFTSANVPPVSETGYSLGKRIDNLFVYTLFITADGFEDLVLHCPENFEAIPLRRRGSPNHAVEPTRPPVCGSGSP
jgi:hypothetical protein